MLFAADGLFRRRHLCVRFSHRPLQPSLLRQLRSVRADGVHSDGACRHAQVHEGAHALACLIFGHRIHEIRLFSINPDDGVLGYVRHSCNPKSFYQRLGNFFIGTGARRGNFPALGAQLIPAPARYVFRDVGGGPRGGFFGEFFCRARMLCPRFCRHLFLRGPGRRGGSFSSSAFCSVCT